ncbi:unnamed protein product [Amaranthus hypochondriacus]
MFREKSLKKRNPWERIPEPDDVSKDPDLEHYLTKLAHKWPKFASIDQNHYLDAHTKRAAFQASPFVVSLESYSGDKKLNRCSGVIIGNDDNNTGIIFTSANLIRQLAKEGVVAVNIVADDLKILVRVADGRVFDGEICCYDFHYNLAAIQFVSDSTVSSAPMKLVNDSLDLLYPLQSHERSFQLQPHTTSISLVPGDAIVALGRYFASPYEIMAAPGVFSLDCCHYVYGCKELFKATCRITKCGDGGPLLNLAGDVIGITFYDHYYTPFLPINIAHKWWEVYKKFGKVRRPFVGIRATNLYAADLDFTEKILRTFPNISKGVLVEMVISGSGADAAGLLPNDVIIRFGGKSVLSFLELLEMLWDNIGHSVELIIARAGNDDLLHHKLMVDELTSDQLYSWPLQ